MFLVDANVFMYAAGSDHPNKRAAVRQLERIAEGRDEAALDAEILQEILHRYRAIGRWQEGAQVYDLARRIVPIVFPVTAAITDRARQILDSYARLMARDALHIAIVFENRLRGICSFDRDFDGIRGLKRFEPKIRRTR